MGWKSSSTAAAMRDTIVEIVEKAIERLVPAPSYAQVVSVNEDTRTVRVTYSGEDDNVVGIRCLSLIPVAPGQMVRIGGRTADRYVEAVVGSTSFVYGMDRIGDATVWCGTTAPPGSMECDGAQVEVATYPTLFNAIGYKHGGSGSVFNVPSFTPPGPNSIWIIRVK